MKTKQAEKKCPLNVKASLPFGTPVPPHPHPKKERNVP
jgi:hypothetical protein